MHISVRTFIDVSMGVCAACLRLSLSVRAKDVRPKKCGRSEKITEKYVAQNHGTCATAKATATLEAT